MAERIAFLLLSTLVLAFAIGVVSLRNIFHCALSLAGALLSLAGIYILLFAEFLAIVQVLVYAGGVVALILFAIVLSQEAAGEKLDQVNEQKLLAAPLCFALFFLLLKGIHITRFPVKSQLPEGVLDSLGRSILMRYLIPFELASVILLVAVIGGICFVKRERHT